jgi:hypothetical protein
MFLNFLESDATWGSHVLPFVIHLLA